MVAATLVSPMGKDTAVGHDPFSQTLTPVQILQTRAAAPVVSLPQPVVFSNDHQGNSTGSVESIGQSADKTAKVERKPSTDHESKKRKVSYKIPRYTRRNQSRSEPSNKSQATD